MTASPGPLRRVARNVAWAIAVLLAAALASQPLWLASLVGRDLSASSGRAVRFESMWVGLSTSLEPVVQIRGIDIANAPWADSPRRFAVLQSAVAVVSWRSIEQRRPVIALMVLRDGEVDLEREADGLRNWRLGNPEYRGPGRYKVLALQAERATVRFRHGGIDLDLNATASANAAEPGSADGAAALPTRIDLHGEWRKVAFKVGAVTGPVLTFLETGRVFPLRGRLDAGGARLDVDGNVGDMVHDPLVDAHVTLVAPSLAPFAALVDLHQREAKAIRVDGTLRGSPGSYALGAATVRLGASDFAGDASWTRGPERHVVRATLTSELIDLADLRWLAAVKALPALPAQAVLPAAAASAAASVAASIAASAAASAPAERRGGLAALRAVDAELSLAARRVRAVELPWLESAQLEATLADGRLMLAHFDVGIAKGHASGRASVDAHDGPARVDVEVALRGARVEHFLPEQSEKTRVTGALQGRAQLRASGDSAAALLASATGSIAAALVGGTISSLLDAEIGLQGGKIVRSLIGGAEPLPIHCAAAVLDLRNGKGQLHTLLLDTARTRTSGSGTVDLAHETIDIVLTPESKQGGLFVLDRSIRLHGALRHPGRELVARTEPPAAAPRACPATPP